MTMKQGCLSAPVLPSFTLKCDEQSAFAVLSATLVYLDQCCASEILDDHPEPLNVSDLYER